MLYDPKWEKKTETDQPWQLALRRAADIIDERGHAKHTLQADDGCVCALGALLVADHIYGTNEFNPARKRLMAYVGSYISQWNNAPERTAAEVTQAMRACAGSQ